MAGSWLLYVASPCWSCCSLLGVATLVWLLPCCGVVFYYVWLLLLTLYCACCLLRGSVWLRLLLFWLNWLVSTSCKLPQECVPGPGYCYGSQLFGSAFFGFSGFLSLFWEDYLPYWVSFFTSLLRRCFALPDFCCWLLHFAGDLVC